MIIVNGTDLEPLGFILTDRELPSWPSQDVSYVPVPGSTDAAYLGRSFRPQQLRVGGYLRAATHAALRTAADAVAAALRGELVIRFEDLTDREWVGYLDPSSFREFGPSLIALGGAARLSFSVQGPARAQAESSQGSGALDLGTAPSPIRVEAGGSVTVRVRAGGAGGTILRELVWSGGAAVVIDAETQTVESGGVSAAEFLTPESDFPVADPAEGADYLELSTGTGYFRRRWW